MAESMDLLTVWMAASQSASSSSDISTGLRRYARDVLQAEVRYQPLFTDLRDRTTPIEAEFGQVFQGWA